MMDDREKQAWQLITKGVDNRTNFLKERQREEFARFLEAVHEAEHVAVPPNEFHFHLNGHVRNLRRTFSQLSRTSGRLESIGNAMAAISRLLSE